MHLEKIAVVKPYPSVGFTVCSMHLNYFKRSERLPMLEECGMGNLQSISSIVHSINQNLQILQFLFLFFLEAFHILSGKCILYFHHILIR